MALRKFVDAAGEVLQATTEGADEIGSAATIVAATGIEQAAQAARSATALADNQETQTKVRMNMDNAMKTTEELVSFGQGNFEAFVKAGQIWAAGVQDLGKHVAAQAQAQMEHTVATMKALAGVKSIKEAMEMQSSLARASVEKAMSEGGKLTDASLKLTEQAMAPITARVTLAMEKFGRTA